ncbi:hypothetical protein M422DRAFT_274520 [Sphaerobolus stellatus SS14]|uniref:Uncharacterized protein n=1 Tax=Sphaerobolus stellatus (strain SS14) TaxID=990650 RepID=A0A0C9U688_SPHS4|nr:hypothetical protein M422DRAFT_274520 [Sphaerobolus stellatus SS14]
MASRSDGATESASDILSNVLNAVDDETIRAYRAKCIAPALRIAARGHFLVRNANQWVDLEKFLDFVSKQAQRPEPQTPKHSRPLPDSSSLNIQTYTTFSSHSDVADRPTKHHCSSLDNSPFPSSPPPFSAHLSVFNTNPQPPPAAQPTVTTPEQPDIMNTKKWGRKVTKADKQGAAGRIRVTRKLWVDGTFNVSGPMENWPVPIDGKTYAYIVDLTDSAIEYKDSKGENLSMANIIKMRWEGGTGGSTAQPTSVALLGGVDCQRAIHTCRGIFLCSYHKPDLWEGYQRWEYDFEPFRELFHQDMANNAAEHDISFYNSVIHEKCTHNRKCNGHAVLRQFNETSSEGKNYFVGCSAWKPADGKSSTHLFRQIPSHVNEELVVDIFTEGGLGQMDMSLYSDHCCHTVPSRTGLKQQYCCTCILIFDASLHISDEYRMSACCHIRDGHVVQGTMKQCKCSAQIIIFSPVNKNEKKAIIIPLPGKPHNHPSNASSKFTYAAADAWRTAIEAAGPIGKSVGQIICAPTTAPILEEKGAAKASQFACLARPRYLQNILTDAKRKMYPNGFDLPELKLAPTHPYRYIHAIISEPSDDGKGQVTVIVTMVPGLAKFTHDAHTTLHDNTYKCVHGKFNEWEVIIWNARGNKRITVARTYCNRETRQAFRLIWSGWLNALEKATGHCLKIKPFHNYSKLKTILINSSTPQIQGLGDILLLENDPTISGIDAMTAEEIVQWLVRTCNWHFKHNLDLLSQVLPKEDMDHICGFQHLQFYKQMDDFIKWASTHPEKKLQDWIANKVVHPWYIPSLCKHFSKIPGFDWDLSPADNNLNETSHPATNRATGIALPLVEAIERARPYDIQVLTDLQKLEETCVQRNPHNTLKHRFSSNGHRHNSRSLKYDEAHEKREKLAGIDKRLAKVEEDRRWLETQSKALRAERKLASGGKRTHTKVAPGRHPTLPAFGKCIVADPVKENENPFLVVASTSALTLDPELEPLPPTLSYFPSSVTPSPFYSSGSGSRFPSSTCPPSFRNPSYSPFSNTARLAAQELFWHRYQ